ncbi:MULTISPECIES: DEAD/DEAH box helicase [unclassified Candidatus Frackibacter]|uniref:DEAD/DEAH box helicase n=1 Tax=unclassified Candidatus Frackibacter TaxID=2648818 RepID=UPI0008920BBE|nr:MULTISPECIES: DEAD/DEAH box helicase [unclassified Candidatus Frackibacter]SDC68093.1 ATP-dependent RNA helicase DeaD [Candidatus Frackibacter sp. WG11]SEM83552.1 ATP-dependent RNA helicase DeaD [Candidatus Frackibacter sp. WG12]SFL91700.1 ATP-dependent RNA helicase DeaD [Candidatus Frackibacter sp. WG13]
MQKKKFEDLNLSKEINKAVEDMGFEEATPIQAQAIPHILKGEDVIGQAQTGTGKTAAFGIPILEKVDSDNKSVQALVLCPTRELAIQVSEEIGRLAKYKRKIKTLPVYGGQSIRRQIKALKKGVQIVIGTPGRTMDHMRRGTLKIDNLKMAILDEADEMLNMGFRDDIETILRGIKGKRQTIFFSATMPQSILKLRKKYQNNPEIVKVVHKKLTVPNIEQAYFEVKRRNKLEVLSRLIDIYNPKLSIIFCNTRKQVDELTIQLQARGYFVDGIHGGLNQSQRDRVMNKFKNGTIETLVATDVAARGIDVDDVEAVFNYDIPQDLEYYVHRIGRTGRVGRQGYAFTFVVGKEIYQLKKIEKYAKTKIKRRQVPSASDVEESKMELLLDEVSEIIESDNLSKENKLIEGLIEEDYVSVDIAAALLKLVMERENREGSEEIENFGDTGAEPGMVRLFINIGKKQKISPGDVVGAIAGETSIPGDLVGLIDIYNKFTFVEVPREYAKEVLQIMKDNRIKGKNIDIELANPK